MHNTSCVTVSFKTYTSVVSCHVRSSTILFESWPECFNIYISSTRNQVHEETSLHISHLMHKTSYSVHSKINFLVGPQKPLLTTVKRQKLAWFGHVTRHDSLSKTILPGTLEGGRRVGRQRKCWMDIKE